MENNIWPLFGKIEHLSQRCKFVPRFGLRTFQQDPLILLQQGRDAEFRLALMVLAQTGHNVDHPGGLRLLREGQERRIVVVVIVVVIVMVFKEARGQFEFDLVWIWKEKKL